MSPTTAGHPSSSQLADFVLGKLDPEAIAEVEQHLETCSDCCDQLDHISDDYLAQLAHQCLQNGLTSDTHPSAAGDTSVPGFAGSAAPGELRELAEHARYTILEHVGSGGMGDVYKAQHRLMNRIVALKVIRRELTQRPEVVSRFRQEVRLAARLSHPHIVTAFDAERIGDTHFLVMEYVPGTSWERWMTAQGPVSESDLLQILQDVTSALQHAHEQGMVHRDIKPQNLLRTSLGTTKILDFGLARIEFEPNEEPAAGESVGLTRPQATIGTPDYMAPEQADDARTVDIRSDIYSLGCTCYFLLTGHPPFPDGSAMQKISSHLLVDPAGLETIRPELSPPILQLVERMMRKDPADRYQTPDELAEAIQAAFATIDASPRETTRTIPSTGSARGQASPASTPSSSRTDVDHRSGLRWHRWWRRYSNAIQIGILTLIVVAAIYQGFTPSRPRRVLAVLPNNLWYPDYIPVRDLLLERGIEVVSTAHLRHVVPADPSQGEPFDVDQLLVEVDPSEFDAVVFVGGVIDDLTDEGPAFPQVQRIVQVMDERERIVSGICLGGCVLSDTGRLVGHEVAYSDHIQHEFHSGRATAVFEPVVVSGRLITADDPDSAVAFAEALVEALEGLP